MPLPAPTEQELNGCRLYGEDFSHDEVVEWFEDERNAYADLGSSDRAAYRYSYHGLNLRHGFRYLPQRQFEHALGIGSAYGDEFLSIEDRVGRLTIVEPSPELRNARLRLPVEYVEPQADGALPMPSRSVDLVLCLSVLHHIAKVSFAITEIARVLRAGGFAVIREPTISMGDWRKQRRGLTAHERGIPLRLLRDMIADVGLEVVNETRCMFSLTTRLTRLAGIGLPYNSAGVVVLDAFACRLFGWNQTYHATHLHQRFRSTGVYLVLTKR